MPATLATTGKITSSETLSSSIARICHGIVNSYFISDPDSGKWVLVDAGLKTSAGHIRKAAEERFGRGAEPAAIILTHGHFDHVGALEALLKHWDVPVYAHRLEAPYLTGRGKYPPADPTVGGGMMAQMSRFFTRGPINIAGRLRALPDNGSVPGLSSSWRWIHTPGHSPGHISLFDEDHRALIAGDAFVTTKQESATAVLTQKTFVNGPPAYFTPDWRLARDSVRQLAALKPELAATGHGKPMRGADLTTQLTQLARDFDTAARPRHGRYVERPALMDEFGVVWVPPRASDPMLKAACLMAGGIALVALATYTRRRRRHSRGELAVR
jgi:glyoxylase-like metal-dependent hydrolase (beta-lactamase superfamily II)